MLSLFLILINGTWFIVQDGQTAMMVASAEEKTEVVEMLKKYGADNDDHEVRR